MPPVLTSLPWNAQIGKVLQSIGTPFFHEELIDLLGLTVESDAFWIIRYAGEAAPDVVFTRDVSVQTERVYSKRCARIDPFSARWKSLREAGILTLGTLRANDPADTAYSDIFLHAAEMDDELGIILPITESNCFAIFLERRQGLFTDAEVHILETVHPTIAGCFQSHLGCLFGRNGHTRFSSGAADSASPTAVFDHAAQLVYFNEAWSRAARRFPSLRRQASGLALSGGSEAVSQDWVLRAERLNPGFPLAPNGSRLVLERAAPAAFPHDGRERPDPFSRFTPRERDVLRLVLRGATNDDIATALGLGAGSIRNIKLRLYRKSGVSSESELVPRFLSVAPLP